MPSLELIKSLCAGALAGLASGFLGVSPGGILVAVISLLLPFSQHVVQGISLLVQAPPTGLTGISSYAKSGRRVVLREVLLVALGFIAGGPLGAILARLCTDRALRWMYVGYLLLLAVLATVKKSKPGPQPIVSATKSRPIAPLLFIGLVAGTSSGLLGIGGGLAITALSVLLLHRDQHTAQALSLAITMLPLTLPAAWVYIRQGWAMPWTIIVCLVAGLAVGTWVGSAFANRLPERTLKFSFAALLLAMAGYMAAVALRS
jgi:uncharacterized protein